MSSRSAFVAELTARTSDPANRRWLFVPYDQLSDGIGPLAREDPRRLGIVLVETSWKGARRPYHRQKLALVLANQRHFALEQAARGVAVRHVVSRSRYADALAPIARELGPLRCQQPAERELRADLAPLVAAGALEILPHEGWLTSRADFDAAFAGGKRWRMDRFYRHVRQRSGLLMEDGGPVGGRYSFDTENRKPWRGEPPAPDPPRFTPDAITQEVGDLIEQHFCEHPGRLDLTSLPATARDAETLWRWARRACLPHFGPFEDAMASASSTLFHTRVSPLLNNHRLLPARIVAEAARLDVPLPSREGFVRQVLGWREFLYHVHEATDGFRALPDGSRPPVAGAPGVGGWSRWTGRSWPASAAPGDPDGGAQPNHLHATLPIPPAYWGTPSGLACLDRVVSDVWQEGWSHHITRLMVLSNLATLLGVDPRELTDWFWAAYVDAYDWVVEPNVLGMGSFALGDLFTTKPYVSGAAYIDKMSDYCRDCAFAPKHDCPVTSLYWNFLAEHRDVLDGNPRVAMPLRSESKRAGARRTRDSRVAQRVRKALAAGRAIEPRDLTDESLRDE